MVLSCKAVFFVIMMLRRDLRDFLLADDVLAAQEILWIEQLLHERRRLRRFHHRILFVDRFQVPVRAEGFGGHWIEKPKDFTCRDLLLDYRY